MRYTLSPSIFNQGMAAVEHLLSAVRDVIQRLFADGNDTTKSTTVAFASSNMSGSSNTSTSGGGGGISGSGITASPTSPSTSSPWLTLSAMADSAANLAQKVRWAQTRTFLPPTGAGGKGQPKGAAESKKSSSSSSSTASCFRWSDGVLVQALERGDWVVLDGANLCSAR